MSLRQFEMSVRFVYVIFLHHKNKCSSLYRGRRFILSPHILQSNQQRRGDFDESFRNSLPSRLILTQGDTILKIKRKNQNVTVEDFCL